MGRPREDDWKVLVLGRELWTSCSAYVGYISHYQSTKKQAHTVLHTALVSALILPLLVSFFISVYINKWHFPDCIIHLKYAIHYGSQHDWLLSQWKIH